MKNKLYTCMGCGFKVFEEVFSATEICDICGYQDDVTCMLFPSRKDIGANTKKTLLEFQLIAFTSKLFDKNPIWKPINIKKLNNNYPYFPQWKYEEYYKLYGENINDSLKTDFLLAQKYNPDKEVHLS